MEVLMQLALIMQLGDSKFSVRHKADQQLAAMSVYAFPSLEDYLRNPDGDPERHRRVHSLYWKCQEFYDNWAAKLEEEKRAKEYQEWMDNCRNGGGIMGPPIPVPNPINGIPLLPIPPR